MEQAIQHGADVIIRDWVRLRAGERILIVSSQKYAVEVAAMQQAAQAVGSVADVLMLDDLHEQVGQYFDDREDAFDPYNAVIGAAEYSLITTRAVKRVIAPAATRFLSAAAEHQQRAVTAELRLPEHEPAQKQDHGQPSSWPATRTPATSM